MQSYITTFGIFLFISLAIAEDGKMDVPVYLPLLERNSIARKVLDVTYSVKYEDTMNGKVYTGRQDVHLVFDIETGKHREETKFYDNPSDVDKYELDIKIWNGEEYVSWRRLVSREPGFRSLGHGVYEHSGSASIKGRPFVGIPQIALIFCNYSARPFEKVILNQEPKLASLDGNSITIDTLGYKFEFSKKNSALERLTFYTWNEDDNRVPSRTYDLSNHVERARVWIPLQITEKEYDDQGNLDAKAEYSVDPQTLRLYDKVEDSSIFNEVLPAGCVVNDQIRKKTYMVTTADTLPNDVEALKKALDKMLEQAQEQKAAVEAQEQEKKK